MATAKQATPAEQPEGTVTLKELLEQEVEAYSKQADEMREEASKLEARADELHRQAAYQAGRADQARSLLARMVPPPGQEASDE